MSREWCIVVRPVADATWDELKLIRLAFEMHKPPFDYVEDDGDYLVYVDAPHNVERVEKAVMRAFAQSEVSAAVVTPLVVGRRIDDEEGYSFSSWFEEDAQPEPAVPADEISWCLSVKPVSAFGWTALQDELSHRGRTKIGEDDHRIEVAARDEQDARTLLSELQALSLAGEGSVKPLGWFRRWRIRQQLLGNYTPTDDDITQPR